MPYAIVGKMRFHYVESGSGRPLLLVHGFPLDHTMWAGQLEALSRHFRCIAVDLRGFGRSDVTDGSVTMEQHADDLAEILDTIGIREPVLFCGLSMGGYVAWQFWMRHAKRLAALILCDTRAAADTPEAAQGRLKMADKVLAQGPQELVDTMVPKLFAEETIRTQPAIVEATKNVILATPPAGIAAALRGMAQRMDFTGELAKINFPTLAICGEQDVISKSAEMRELIKSMPQAQFVEVPHAGHMSPLEQPKLVNSAIEQFLASL